MCQNINKSVKTRDEIQNFLGTLEKPNTIKEFFFYSLKKSTRKKYSKIYESKTNKKEKMKEKKKTKGEVVTVKNGIERISKNTKIKTWKVLKKINIIRELIYQAYKKWNTFYIYINLNDQSINHSISSVKVNR